MKQHLMRNINTISRCAALYRDAHLADCGLSGWQAPYIPEICAAPGITQDQLALRLHVNRSNVTRQSAMLEENGFVYGAAVKATAARWRFIPRRRPRKHFPPYGPYTGPGGKSCFMT
ncbi:MAG: MarR family transcriptional regulator [Ruthenibacterium lactatiformans]